MHARVTHSKVDPTTVDELIGMIKENVVPMVKKQPGFRGGYWMFDRATGKRISITLWESEQALRSSDAVAKQLRDRGPVGLQIIDVEDYEVAVQA